VLTAEGDSIDIMAFAPCGACGALVSVYLGCRHWSGANNKVGKPGRVPGRSPGAASPLPAEQRIG
jgi:hypothetical protein